MGVYIKNMEMPKNCHECRLYEGDIYYCSAADKMIDISDSSAEKCQFCPLFPVPPHGRLIDADELRYWSDDSAMIAFDYVTRSQINAAPTIIPAEEGET
jgi:hypothetical protein